LTMLIVLAIPPLPFKLGRTLPKGVLRVTSTSRPLVISPMVNATAGVG